MPHVSFLMTEVVVTSFLIDKKVVSWKLGLLSTCRGVQYEKKILNEVTFAIFFLVVCSCCALMHIKLTLQVYINIALCVSHNSFCIEIANTFSKITQILSQGHIQSFCTTFEQNLFFASISSFWIVWQNYWNKVPKAARKLFETKEYLYLDNVTFLKGSHNDVQKFYADQSQKFLLFLSYFLKS